MRLDFQPSVRCHRCATLCSLQRARADRLMDWSPVPLRAGGTKTSARDAALRERGIRDRRGDAGSTAFPHATCVRVETQQTTIWAAEPARRNTMDRRQQGPRRVRETFGKGAARKIRAAGKIPAVIYGHGTEPPHVTLPGHQVGAHPAQGERRARARHRRQEQLALVKDVQKDPVRQIIEHIDLIVVRKGEKVQVDVPVHVEGESLPRHDRRPRRQDAARSRSRPPTSPRTSSSTSRASRRARRSPPRTSSCPRARRLLDRPRDARRRRRTCAPTVDLGEAAEAAPRASRRGRCRRRGCRVVTSRLGRSDARTRVNDVDEPTPGW